MNKKVPEHWLEIAKRINSIAQTGLTYTKDKFDRERYTELLNLSITILNNITEMSDFLIYRICLNCQNEG
jgi:hypothetical protein